MGNEYNFFDKYSSINQMSKPTAEYFMQSALQDLEEARNRFQNENYGSAYYSYKSAVKKYSELVAGIYYCDFRNEFSEKIDALFEEAGYHLGLCCYDDFKFDEAIYVLDYRSGDSTRVAALLALCYRKQTSVPIPEREYTLAYEYIKKVLRDKEYAATPKSKFEEAIYVEVMILASEIYRIGSEYEKFLVGKYSPYKGLFPDIDKSIQLLNSIQEYIIYDSNKLILSKQLAHYKKKLFGGYKYV